MELTDVQIERYSRQIILPAIGGRGQRRLLEATVSLIGDGPLASTAAIYLTAAGVGRLELWTSTGDAFESMQTAQQDLGVLNPDTMVQVRALDSIGLGSPAARPAVFVCADVTAVTLARVNHAALRWRVALLAGVAGDHASLAHYAGHDTGWPCAACDPAPPVGESPEAVDATTGFIGSLLALEAIKSCLGLPAAQPGRALHYDPATLTITECPISKRDTCRACAPAVAADS